MKKAAALIMLLLLSVGAGILCGQRVSANFIPEQPPPGIVIRADGTIEGTRLISCAGNVYTFTADIGRTIVVLRDGIIIDGAGHSLQGSGSSVGFFLQARNNVEIRNTTISNFEIGIKFTWLNYGSTALATRNTVSANKIVNNSYGVVFSDPYTTVTLRSNEFLDNKYGILDDVANGNDVDASNAVNGKPIYYWVNQHDKSIPSNAGFVVLKNCSGIVVRNLDLRGNAQGILLYYTNDSTIEGNFLGENVDGVVLRESFGNTVTGNHVANNRDYGVHLDYNSRNNTVSGNKIESNGVDGVYDGYYSFGSSPGNVICQNEITGNRGNGVTLYNEADSFVVENNVTLNGGSGIRLAYGTSNITVKGNYVARNGLGLLIESPGMNYIIGPPETVNGTSVNTSPIGVKSKGSIITENTVIENNGWAIRLNKSEGGNIIYRNNFINNNVTDGIQVSIPAVMIFDPPGSVQDGPTMAPGLPNVWDNGQEGNYWSEYMSRYPNASEVGGTGVGDTPFYINENNIDNFPLMQPFNKESDRIVVPYNSSDTTNSKSGVNLPAELIIPPVALAVAVVAAVAVVVYEKKRRASDVGLGQESLTAG